jgi:hypothetical protein
MLSTIVLARFFGASSYAAYIIDLAYISMFLIVLELFPSSFSVFKFQDEDSYAGILATFNIFIAIFISVFVTVAYLIPEMAIFIDFSWWMVAYIFVFSLKRYLDIKYQAENRLKEYLSIDLFSAIIRLFFLSLALYVGYRSADSIWGSLVIATLISQAYWVYKHPNDLPNISDISIKKMLAYFVGEIPVFRSYYFGISLKKLKDNAVPLAASYFFLDKELAGVFLLNFRGLVFSCSLLRSVEAFLNHRKNIDFMGRLSRLQYLMVPIIGHVIAIAAAIGLSFFSGTQIEFVTIAILGVYIYPFFMNITMRAGFFSKYNPTAVSFALLASITTIFVGVFCLDRFDIVDSSLFSSVLVLSESMMLAIFFVQSKFWSAKDVSEMGP